MKLNFLNTNRLRRAYLDALGQIESVDRSPQVRTNRCFQLDVRRTGRRRIEQQSFHLFLFLGQHGLRRSERQLKEREKNKSIKPSGLFNS